MPLINLSFSVEKPTRLVSLPGDIQRMAARAAGNEVLAVVRENFTARGGESYWRQAAEATSLEVREDGAVVTVRHPGVRLHLLGGVVEPGKGASSKSGKKTRLLAIPQGSFKEAPLGYPAPLAFIPIKRKPHLKGILLPGEKRQARRKWKGKPAGREIIVASKGAKAAYFLVNQTTHKPDSTVLPTQQRLAEAGRAGIHELMEAIKFTSPNNS